MLAAGRRVIVRIPSADGVPGAPPAGAAIVVDLETRTRSTRAATGAAERMGRALRKAGARVAYFKIDSTLRGHPFAEGEALRASTGAPLAWYVPANPSQGRLTIGGRQFVRGVRVERTEFARDPLHPVASGDLIALAGAVVGPARVAHLNVSGLRRGPGYVRSLRRAWLRSGCRAVVADVVHPADLGRLAAVIPGTDLPVGAAALAGMMLGRSGPEAPRSRARRGVPRTLGVIGSLNPTTAAQVRALADRPGVVVRRITRGALVASVRLAPPASARVWIVCLEPGSFRSVRPSAVGSIAASLGRVAAAAFAAFQPSRLFLSGGLTALAACRALGITEYELRGLPASGVTLASASVAGRPVELLTKPGGFGPPDALLGLAGFPA